MKITDELLSAFLDGELPEAQMQHIRDALVTDDSLVDRLAELAQVDNLVAQHAAKIDLKPLPVGITSLLQDNKRAPQNKVVQMSAWRKVNQLVTRHAAIAAGIALFFGFGINSWIQDDLPQANHAVSNQIANILDIHTSGQTIAAEDGSQVKPYFSFENKQGQYCRHYQLQQADSSSANLACRDNKSWTLVASVETTMTNESGLYQAASSAAPLTDIIDKLTNGPILDLNQEQAAIAKNWQANTK